MISWISFCRQPGRRPTTRATAVESFRSVRLDRPESIEELPRNYDFVLFVEVLEHLLVDPIVLFRSIYNRLGPEGRLLLTTPNMARLGNRWKLARGRSIKEGERFPQDGSGGFGHVIEYTLDELDYLLKWESFVRERARIVQHLPHLSSKGLRRRAIPWLNSGFAERLRLGDDILALYRIVPRPPPGTPRTRSHLSRPQSPGGRSDRARKWASLVTWAWATRRRP